MIQKPSMLIKQLLNKWGAAAIYFLLLAFFAPPAYTEAPPNHDGANHLAAPKGPDSQNIMNIDVERLQSIGVKFEEAKYRLMEEKNPYSGSCGNQRAFYRPGEYQNSRLDRATLCEHHG